MISFTWKYSIFQVIQIFIIICYFLQFLFCIGFGYNDVTINILQYELLLIFLWSLFSAIHESGTFNLYVLFLYMLCVFIYSRIFLDIYGLFNWTWADKYNDFMLTFVGESHRKEDELFSLLDTDTLLQYGSKVHALRVKANALGLRNLTDTAFFHEMEAYAGNLEVVQANWEKLSFEWDEACDLFTDYIQSLGLKDHATDSQGNQITFKRWGEQLHEAFNALETYDPDKARAILNELLQYQIDADITKSLETIVANIDEVMKA